jgi:hypothetical protein
MMSESSISILLALLGIFGGIAGGYFAGRQQKSLEYEKWLRAREDDAAKETRLAVAELTRKLGEAVHSMTWLTWKAAYQPSKLAQEDISTYDREMHSLLPALAGSLAIISALSNEMYRKMSPIVNQVYALDASIAAGATQLEETPQASAEAIGACHAETYDLRRNLNENVAEILNTSMMTTSR